MKYSELLSRYIKESGMSLSEIAEKASQYGVKVDKSYISKLKNNMVNSPSDEISIAIAKATGGDPEALVLSSYYEKAPEGVKIEFKKIAAYDKLMDFLVKKKPFDVEFVPTDNMSETEIKKELEEGLEYFNSPEYFNQLPEAEADDFITDLVKLMAERYPDDFLELVESMNATFSSTTRPNRLEELRHKHKKKHLDLAKELGISPIEYLNLERPGFQIKEEHLNKLSDLYNVSQNYLLGSPDNNLEDLVPLKDQMLKLPILGAIRAGTPIDRIEYNEGYTLVDSDTLRGREAFALRVTGDSMSGDRIKENDIVIVVKQQEVLPHEIAVVAINDDYATLKRVKQVGDMCMLIPSNPTMSPELVPCNEVKIIGKVVEVKISFD